MSLQEVLEELGESDATAPFHFPYMKRVGCQLIGATKFFSWQGWGGDESDLATDFVAIRTGGPGDSELPESVSVAIARVSVNIDATHLPLVQIPNGEFQITHVSLAFVSRVLNEDEITTVNRRIRGWSSSEHPLPQLPTPRERKKTYYHRWIASIASRVAREDAPLLIVRAGETASSEASTGLAPPSRLDSVAIHLRFLNLRIDAVSAGFQNGSITVSLTASMVIGGMTMTLDGLGFILDMNDWKFGYTIAGGSISYDPADVSVGARLSAALRRTHTDDEDVEISLVGMGTLDIEDCALIRFVVGYSQYASGWVSVLFYCELLLPSDSAVGGLGWPPTFVITGISFGFGWNSTLRTPRIEELPAFPLVSRLDAAPALPGDPAPPPLTPTAALNQLAGDDGWLQQLKGQFWAAGGLQFRMFNYIDARALVVVEGGQTWTVMLFGSTTIAVPGRSKTTGPLRSSPSTDSHSEVELPDGAVASVVLSEDVTGSISLPKSAHATLELPADSLGDTRVPHGTTVTVELPKELTASITLPKGTRLAVELPKGTRVRVDHEKELRDGGNHNERETIGRINVHLAIVYRITEKIISMDVALAPGSYVVDKQANVFGGISFYYDIGNGEFAFSIGGYHPQYKRPDTFPNPPRIGAVGQLDKVVVKGELYLAVVPQTVMAGMNVVILYDVGRSYSFSWWLNLHIDVMYNWSEYYFDLVVGIRVGVAAMFKVGFVRIRVSAEIGVGVSIWTPPFGGRASIKLWFVTLNIGFGSDRAGPQPVPWSEFATQLPAPVRLEPVDGIEPPAVPGPSGIGTFTRSPNEPDSVPETVSSDGFSFATQSSLPVTRITLNGRTVAEDEKVQIRPMGLQHVTSVQRVTLSFRGRPFDPVAAGWRMEEVRGDFPRGMWGPPVNDPKDTLTEDAMVHDKLSGLRFTVPPPRRGPALGPITSRSLDVTELPDGSMPLRQEAPQGPWAQTRPDSVDVVGQTISAPTTANRRSALFDTLLEMGACLAPEADGALNVYAADVDNLFTSPPLTTAAAR